MIRFWYEETVTVIKSKFKIDKATGGVVCEDDKILISTWELGFPRQLKMKRMMLA
jgi:hypothetical protein